MKQRNGKIDFLRLVFALIIVLHHSRYVLGYDDTVFIGGSMGVEFFFLVSGYLMMAHIERVEERPERQDRRGLGSETYHYLLGKVRGLLPEFVIAMLIGSIFVAAAEKWSAHQIWRHVITGFGEYSLLRMAGIYETSINGVTWYLSAMLLSMAILYPLIRKRPDMMKHVGLPLIAVLLLGFLCQMDGSTRNPNAWLYVASKGLLRGLAEISLGGLCYLACVHVRQWRLRPFGRGLVTIAEVLCYLLPIRYMYYEKPSKDDYFFLFLLLLGVLLSFSGQGLLSPLFRERKAGFWRWCSRYSTALFLSHIYFAQHLNRILPEETYSPRLRLMVYLCLALGNGFVVMGLAALARRHGQKIRGFFHGILLQS